MKKKSIVITEVRFLGNGDGLCQCGVKLNFHVADQFHEEWALLFFVLIIQLRENITIVSFDELPLENLERLN